MFSRAAKSIVKTIGQRKYHAGEENIKVTLMGGAGEIGRSLSQMMKQASKLDATSLYNAASFSKRLPIRFHTVPEAEPPKPVNSWMLNMLDNTRVAPKRQATREPIAYLSTGPSSIAKNETDELMEVLRRLTTAEEGAVNPLRKSMAIVSQGDNACVGDELRGPRVLGEMGPATIRQGGRIVTEISKQLPELADRLGRDRAKRGGGGGNRPALRQLSTFAVSLSGNVAGPRSGARKQELDLDLGDVGAIPRVARISERLDRKRGRKDERKSNATVLAAVEDRAPIDRRRPRLAKPKEARGPTEPPSKTEKRGKPRNWTIPAALSDKKPKLLYGLVQQRRTPVAWFFSSLFQSQKSDPLNDSPNFKQPTRGKKFDPPREPKLARDSSLKIAGGSGRDISGSVTDSTVDSAARFEVSESEGLANVAVVEEPGETIDGSATQDGVGDAGQRVAPTSSIETSISELSEPPRALGSVSSKLAQFLENLRINRRKSSSMSSLTSYHLDSLFAGEAAAPIHNRLGTVRFSSKGFVKRPKIAPVKTKDDAGKKTERNKASGDGGGFGKKAKADLYGEPCKKIEPECGQTGDVCKKYKKPELYGKDCKAAEDPCKKVRDEKLYGKPCKDYEDSFGSEDPLEKLWEEKLYGKRCKESKSTGCGSAKCGGSKEAKCGGGKTSDPCGGGQKSDPCGGDKKQDPCGIKKPEPCGGKKDSDPCGGKKKEDPCGGKKKEDPCGKKPDPCGQKQEPCGGKKKDPCGQKQEPCGGKKKDPCGQKQDPCGGKKKDPCGQKPDPCGKKKDPCGQKPDPCGGKKKDPCGKKKDDPCGKKKQDRCGKKKGPCGKKKPDPCGKKMLSPSEEKKKPAADKKVPVVKKEKKGDKECPPVFRAPAGCPNNDKGGDKKFSTDSRIYTRSISSCKRIGNSLSGFPRIIDRFSMPELRPRIESRRSPPFNWFAVDS